MKKKLLAVILGVSILLSSCGQPVLPPVDILGQQTIKFAESRGIDVESVTPAVTFEDESQGVFLTGNKEGLPVMLIATQPKEGEIWFAEVEGTNGTVEDLSSLPVRFFDAEGNEIANPEGDGLEAQNFIEWLKQRLWWLIDQYRKLPDWQKGALKGPIKWVLRQLIGAAVDWGCNWAYETLIRNFGYQWWNSNLSRAVLCEILLN